MKYFIDTEFIESGPSRPIELISLSIVSEDGREFYEISSEFDPSNADDWVKENVLSRLEPTPGYFTEPIRVIADRVIAFVGDDQKPEFWGYYADYDWVVFCQMFGTMMDLPTGWPMWCMDLKQWCASLGNPRIPEQASAEHNALHDARWNRDVFNFLSQLEGTKVI